MVVGQFFEDEHERRWGVLDDEHERRCLDDERRTVVGLEDDGERWWASEDERRNRRWQF
jgi:hypothetical protein